MLQFGKKKLRRYAVVWQHIIGMVYVLFAVLSATQGASQNDFLVNFKTSSSLTKSTFVGV